VNFFLETGVYVVIVALAAAVTGFVAFKLFMSVRGTLKFGRTRKKAAIVSKQATDEMDDLNQPPAVSSPPTEPVYQQAQPVPQAQAAVAGLETTAASQAGQPGVPTPSHTPEGVVRDGELGEHDTRAKGHDEGPNVEASTDPQPGNEPAADAETPAGEPPAGEVEALVADEAPPVEDSPADDGPFKSVAAPPEERDGEDAFMAMFGIDDSDESSAGDLAAELEDAEISALLQEAKILALVLKGEGDSNA